MLFIAAAFCVLVSTLMKKSSDLPISFLSSKFEKKQPKDAIEVYQVYKEEKIAHYLQVFKRNGNKLQ